MNTAYLNMTDERSPRGNLYQRYQFGNVNMVSRVHFYFMDFCLQDTRKNERKERKFTFEGYGI